MVWIRFIDFTCVHYLHYTTATLWVEITLKLCVSHKALGLLGLHCLWTWVYNVYSKIIAIRKIAEAKLKKRTSKIYITWKCAAWSVRMVTSQWCHTRSCVCFVLATWMNVMSCSNLFGGSSDLADVTQSVNHPKELKPMGETTPVSNITAPWGDAEIQCRHS